MYRDESNYKEYSTIIFNNPDDLSIGEIRDAMELDSFDYFYPTDCSVMPLDPADDYMLHEVIDISETTEEVTEFQSMFDFIENYRGCN